MVRPDRFLTDDDRKRVLDAVKDAESRTAGEIRVLVVGRSMRRRILAPLLIGAVTGTLAYIRYYSWTWGHPGMLGVYVALALGLVTALILIWAIPGTRKEKRGAVWRRAKREFDRLGIGKTAGATGVLVMFSLWEREAVVLADKAINEKVAPDTWARHVKVLIDAVKAGRPGEGIAAAVKEIGAILAQHFPRRPDDVNELPDEVETRQ
ncbi:MAG TPA: hypothetical protein VK661_10230 [Planctomycetota bacterium]|nr:hypothetical protein [Planctomycetota bacterium]